MLKGLSRIISTTILVSSFSLPALAVIKCKELVNYSGPIDFFAEYMKIARKDHANNILIVTHVKHGLGYVLPMARNKRDKALVFDQNSTDGKEGVRIEDVDTKDLILHLDSGAYWDANGNPGFRTFRGLLKDMRIKIGQNIYEAKAVYQNGDVLFVQIDNPPTKMNVSYFGANIRRLSYIEAVNRLHAFAKPIAEKLKPGMLVRTRGQYLFSDLWLPKVKKVDGLLVTLDAANGTKPIVAVSELRPGDTTPEFPAR